MPPTARSTRRSATFSVPTLAKVNVSGWKLLKKFVGGVWKLCTTCCPETDCCAAGDCCFSSGAIATIDYNLIVTGNVMDLEDCGTVAHDLDDTYTGSFEKTLSCTPSPISPPPPDYYLADWETFAIFNNLDDNLWLAGFPFTIGGTEDVSVTTPIPKAGDCCGATFEGGIDCAGGGDIRVSTVHFGWLLLDPASTIIVTITNNKCCKCASDESCVPTSDDSDAECDEPNACTGAQDDNCPP